MSYGGQDEEGNPDGKAKGTINIANYGNGNVYGMYTPEAYDGAEGEQQPIIANNSDNGAQSVINLVNTGSGVTTGLRGGQRSHIENTGEININNLGDGTAVGIYGGAGSNILNRGKSTYIVRRIPMRKTERYIIPTALRAGRRTVFMPKAARK